MAKPKATKTGATKEHKGTTVAEYSDGSWRYIGLDGTTKGALAIKPDWLVAFTPETALVAQEIGVNNRQKVFIEGAIDGISGIAENILTKEDAMRFIVSKRAEAAASCDPGTLADAKWIDEGIHGSQKKDAPLPKIEIQVDGNFIQAIQQVRDRHAIEDTVIEGEFVDQS